MKTENSKRSTGCPVAFGLDCFGDRWTLLVIRDMMVHGKRTYSAFLASEEQVATNILISRLKQLEADGIVNKERDPNNRRSYIYSLTQKGQDLAPVLLEIIRWGGKHDSREGAKRKIVDQLEQDQEGLEQQLRSPSPD
ncbi:MAG: transcriptional regulator [Rhodobacteraceae bacterium]|nr:MAG: transcriptional regulator [Paracoccaceae bacterium]